MNLLDLKDAVRARDGYACKTCGMTNADHKAKYGRQLDVHRVTPGSPYSVEGCVTLCKACHGPHPKRKPGEPDLAKKNYAPKWVVFAHLDPELRQAVDRYRNAQEYPPAIARVIERALKELLERHGL